LLEEAAAFLTGDLLLDDLGLLLLEELLCGDTAGSPPPDSEVASMRITTRCGSSDGAGVDDDGGIGVDDDGGSPLLVLTDPFRIRGDVGRESSL
jgi:hypothetical protein